MNLRVGITQEVCAPFLLAGASEIRPNNTAALWLRPNLSCLLSQSRVLSPRSSIFPNGNVGWFFSSFSFCSLKGGRKKNEVCKKFEARRRRRSVLVSVLSFFDLSLSLSLLFRFVLYWSKRFVSYLSSRCAARRALLLPLAFCYWPFRFAFLSRRSSSVGVLGRYATEGEEEEGQRSCSA